MWLRSLLYKDEPAIRKSVRFRSPSFPEEGIGCDERFEANVPKVVIPTYLDLPPRGTIPSLESTLSGAERGAQKCAGGAF
eukprot:1178702-Prorocentrum_minimum.AAC.1